MADPFLLPSIAALTGGSLLFRDYLEHRLVGSEDRYMALYGQSAWDGSNMDLTLHVDPAEHATLVAAVRARLSDRLARRTPDTDLFREVASPTRHPLAFETEDVTFSALCRPRRGVWLDVGTPGTVRVVWNHMQTDGVGMWEALRPLFDDNPPLVTYRDVQAPPPLLPELLGLPKLAKRLTWRGALRHEAPDDAPLQRGLVRWDAAALRTAHADLGGAFNLLTAALVVASVFRRHPDRRRLNVGITVYFPFLEGRNRYGVFLARVRRASLAGLIDQLTRETRSPLRSWGAQAAQ
ncbi:MAG: hypothetical protein KC656_36060, partial [Myxococcales bacterium]|nr:hypothetical protein [Myxococcales bacterium]